MPRLVLTIACATVLVVTTCAKKDLRKIAAEKTGGDPDAGKAAMTRYACNACHNIPGIDSSRATGGPSLAHWSARQLIAKRYANTPENLVHWIQDPRALVDTTYMPNMGVKEQEARDIAAYLYTLE